MNNKAPSNAKTEENEAGDIPIGAGAKSHGKTGRALFVYGKDLAPIIGLEKSPGLLLLTRKRNNSHLAANRTSTPSVHRSRRPSSPPPPLHSSPTSRIHECIEESEERAISRKPGLWCIFSIGPVCAAIIDAGRTFFHVGIFMAVKGGFGIWDFTVFVGRILLTLFPLLCFIISTLLIVLLSTQLLLLHNLFRIAKHIAFKMRKWVVYVQNCFVWLNDNYVNFMNNCNSSCLSLYS